MIIDWFKRLFARIDTWIAADAQKYFNALSAKDQDKAEAMMRRMVDEKDRKKRQKLLAMLERMSDEDLEKLAAEVQRLAANHKYKKN